MNMAFVRSTVGVAAFGVLRVFCEDLMRGEQSVQKIPFTYDDR